jgi:hypothetical protein
LVLMSPLPLLRANERADVGAFGSTRVARAKACVVMA